MKNSGSILIVDDEKGQRDILNLIRKKGYDALTYRRARSTGTAGKARVRPDSYRPRCRAERTRSVEKFWLTTSAMHHHDDGPRSVIGR